MSEWGTCEVCDLYGFGHQHPDGVWRCGRCGRRHAQDIAPRAVRLKHCPIPYIYCDWQSRIAGLLPVCISLADDGAIVTGSPENIDALLRDLAEMAAATGRPAWQIVTRAVEEYMERWQNENSSGQRESAPVTIAEESSSQR